MKKDFISIADLSQKEALEVLNLALSIKSKNKRRLKFQPLKGKILAMIFEKPSTRTRVSFEVGMLKLGGNAIFLSDKELQLKRGETIVDTAKTLSQYVDGIVIRANRHKDIIELSTHSDLPVINGLSDLEHPCQVLSDVFTVIEKKSEIKNKKITLDNFKNIKITYIGDGDNIANSLLLASAIFGMQLTICTPKGYEPDREITVKSKNIAEQTGAVIELSNNPLTSVKDSDVLYTDVWVSMGKETEYETRLKIFQPYQVNQKLLNMAKKNLIVMHCLPAHRGEEITSEVLDGPNSVVFDQVKNRLYVQQAILTYLFR